MSFILGLYLVQGGIARVATMSGRIMTCLKYRSDDDYLRKKDFCHSYAYNPRKIVKDTIFWPKTMIEALGEQWTEEKARHDKIRFNATDNPDEVSD